MRVFVAGAGGVIGRPLVRALVAAGHTVNGTTRSAARAEDIEGDGATPVVCDALDADSLRSAVAQAAPEVVVHELTALPKELDPRKKGVYEATSRLRREGTANLIAASKAAAVRRMVAQSVAFLYEPSGDWVKSEDDAVMSRAPGEFGDAMSAVLDLERQVLGAEGIDGIVLRYGFFYGPDSSYATDGYQAREVRRRRFPIVGKGTGTFSYIHVDDAAAATVIAVERGAPGIYNVVDDEPAPMREWLPVYAEAIGARPPRRVPAWLARLVGGSAVVAMATDLRGASNAKAKSDLGWQPAHSSWRQGFREAAG